MSLAAVLVTLTRGRWGYRARSRRGGRPSLRHPGKSAITDRVGVGQQERSGTLCRLCSSINLKRYNWGEIMKPEEAHIDQALIKAQASGEWQKHDYRSLLYVGYAAVDASVAATVSAGRFVWQWSVSTKDKALPFSGQASTLDKAISDAQWHIEQVASVEHQVDVFSSVPSGLQTAPPTTPPQSPPLKPGPVRLGRTFWSDTHVKAFAPAVIAGVSLAGTGVISGASFVSLFLLLLLYLLLGLSYYLPMTVFVYKTRRFSWPFFIVNVLFNWTIIGWLACLGHAMDDEVTTTKPPPVPKPQPRRLQTSAEQESDQGRPGV